MANVYIEDYIEDDYYEDEMAITPLPDPPSRGQTPEVFAEKGDAFLGALPQFAMELDAVAIAMTANSTNATSGAVHTIASTGSKTLQTQIGKSYVVGMTVRAAYADNGTIWMQGDVTSYDPSTGVLVITMNASQGSGTYSSWILSLANASGGAGSLTQDYNVKSLIHAIGANIASGATINLSTATGNLIHVTGSNTISAATMTVGKDVIVIYDGTPVLQYHATNHKLNSGGANITAAAGGVGIYRYDGTTVHVTYVRPDGKANVETATPAGAPVGSFLFHAGSAAPTNYLVCPSSLTNISRTTYSQLFSAIGTTWGPGDWSTTFTMPWFPLGYTIIQANGNVGASDPGENKAHTHTYTDIDNTGSVTTGGSFVNSVGNIVTKTTSSQGSSINAAAGVRVLICVKYQAG